MSGMTQEEMLRNTRTVAQVLDALRDGHELTERAPDHRQISEEKASVVDKNLENIRLGIEEAETMMALALHLQSFGKEKQKLKTQFRKLRRENATLRDGLKSTQEQLQASAQQVVQFEEENKHLEFMNSIKKFDEWPQGADADNKNEQRRDNSVHSCTLQESRFGRNEEEEMQGGNASLAQPTHVDATPTSSNGDYEPHRLLTLYSLVNEYAAQRRYEVAVPLCKQALEEVEESHGHNHPDVATILVVLALIYRDQNKYEEAANLLKDAIAIRERCLGEDHHAVAAALNNLAVMHSKCGKYKEAEALCKRALVIRERVLGHDHPDVAKQLKNLNIIYLNQGKYDASRKRYRRVRENKKAKLGLDDPNVAKTKENLSRASVKQDKYKEAEMLYKQFLTRALEREFSVINKKNKRVRHIAREHEENANTSYHENHSWMAVKGDSPAVTMTLRNLAALYLRQGKWRAAAVTRCAAH